MNSALLTLQDYIATLKQEGGSVRLHKGAVTSKNPNVDTLLVRFPSCGDEPPVMLEVDGHTLLLIQPDPDDEYTMQDVERLWQTGKVM
jgi:hypothetical protein